MDEATAPDRRTLRTFFIIWFGQLVSIVGSGLTAFALGVYIFQRTGEATQLALALLATALPSLLLLPFAGALVDRWDRRRVMLLSDCAAALVNLGIWALLSTGRLEVWHIYVANALNSALGAFQQPAYMAMPTVLVPKQQYGRIAGLMQLSVSISQIAAPLLAGFLLATIDVQGVILIDMATFLFAATTLLAVRVPRPAASSAGLAARGSLLREAGFGWVYLKERPGLLGMLVLFAFANFALSIYSALFTPLVLSFASVEVLGTIISVGGVGMLAGSLLMSAWGGARRKIDSLLGALFISGLFLSLIGLRPNVILIGAASLFFFLLVPVANGSSQAIWQAKVAPDLQGRVFAVRFMVGTAITPLAYLLAGPLADRVFEPLLGAGGALASSAGRIVGVGDGRGIGLMLVLMGLFISVITAVGYLQPRIRNVEKELPDHA